MTRELRTGATGVGAGALTGAAAPLALSVDLSDDGSADLFSLFVLDSADLGGAVFGESFTLGDSLFLSTADCCVTGSLDGGGASRLSGIDGGTGRDDATVAAGVAGLRRIVVVSSVPEADDRSVEFDA
jgi:hypothetical protein